MNIAQWRELDEHSKLAVLQFNGEFIGMEDDRISLATSSLDLFDAYLEEIVKLKKARRDHYSSMAIIHYLRHMTALSDADQVFKISNACAPVFARLAMQTFPGLNGFFETRDGVDEQSVSN